MARGCVKRIFSDENKKYGFIRNHADGASLFFHEDDLRELPLDDTLIERDVEFEIEDHPKGPRARNVCPT